MKHRPARLQAAWLLLIQNPDQQAMLRQHPDLIPAAVEEILRLETPTSGMWRRATADTEIGGVDIPEGAFFDGPFCSGQS